MEIDIRNAIQSEVVGVAKTGCPLEVLPAKVQGIIHNLAIYENYNIEFVVASMISAVASAIGNSLAINIKGGWTTSPILYMMLVGRPGLGKTPPLAFCYEPQRAKDREALNKYLKQYEDYEESQPKGKNESSIGKAPVLVKSLVSDFTPESLVSVHKNNPRGITVLVDEILALFKSANRYTSSNVLNEMLLSSWSGQPIDCVRKSEKKPINVQKPCLNIVGSIQTQLISEIFRKEYIANGLVDRFLFVYPKEQQLSHWLVNSNTNGQVDMTTRWNAIIDMVFSLQCEADEYGRISNQRVIQMSDDARLHFYKWYNGIITDINAIDDDTLVESRKTKLNCNTARIALVLQVMRWAAGESHLQYVDLDSVVGAIKLTDYFEDCYYRIKDKFMMSEEQDAKMVWLSLLPEQFTSNEAEKEGQKMGFSRRSIFNMLKDMAAMHNPPIRKVGHGKYEKVKRQTQDALCTSALSVELGTEDKNADCAQSAIVRSADVKDECTNSEKKGD